MISIFPFSDLFTDSDGSPFTGDAYIGTAGSAADAGNQISVYSDPSLTTQVSQPIKIRNGRFSTGAFPYTAITAYADVVDYSLTLRDENFNTVKSFTNNPQRRFISLSSGSQQITGSTSITGAHTGYILRTTSATAITLTLNSASSLGSKFIIGVVNSGSGNVTIQPQGGSSIDGESSLQISANQSLFITCDGSNFYTIGGSTGGGTGGSGLLPYEASGIIKPKSGSRTIVEIPDMRYKVGSLFYSLNAQDLDIASNSSWVGGTAPNADQRKGKDIYFYAFTDGTIKCDTSTNPAGSYRKVGGCHALCADVGVISGHLLDGFVAGDILPNSVWDLYNGSAGIQDGMVKIPSGNWVSIYLASGPVANLESKYNQTITRSGTGTHINTYHIWAQLGLKRAFCISWEEFQLAALGSPEEMIASSEQNKTGGQSVTNGTTTRRNISNIGCEDMTGVWHQMGRTAGGISLKFQSGLYVPATDYKRAYDADESSIDGATPRGKSREGPSAGYFGGYYTFTDADRDKCGSRASDWSVRPEDDDVIKAIRIACLPRTSVLDL